MRACVHIGRSTKNAVNITSAHEVREAYWKFIREGPYESWYHRFYTRWVSELLHSGTRYLLWGLAPIFGGKAHVYVPILFVLDTLWGNVCARAPLRLEPKR